MFMIQFEVENAALRETNKQHEAQILELQKQVQGKNIFTLSMFAYVPPKKLAF